MPRAVPTLTLFAAALLLSVGAAAQTEPTGPSGSPGDAAGPPTGAAARVDDLLRAAHERGVFHGNALVARDGETIYRGSYGTADAAGAIQLTPDHRFLIGSVSKELSAVALTMLQEEGALSLEDPVARFLPSLPAWAESIRLRNLLTFTSGLPRIRSGEVQSDGEILADLQELPALEFEPGTAYSYNNNDLFLRMRVIEAVSGISFPEFVRTRLFAPCGMRQSTVDPEPGAPLFVQSFDAERAADGRRRPMTGHPAVTAGDLHRWTRCLHAGTLISEASLQDLTRSFGDGAQSALGNAVIDDGKLQAHWHHGQIASYEALYYVNLADGLTVVLLTNSKQNQLGSLTNAVEQAVNGEPYEVPRRVVELALRARIEHEGYAAGFELLQEIEREGAGHWELEDLEDDLTSTGEYLLGIGRAGDAVRVYELTLRRFPGSEAAQDGLAESREALGRMHSAAPSGRRSGDLYDQLARVDSLLFDALFVTCDADRADALLTPDVEFYDDRTGLSVGDDLRGDFRRLTASCPGRGGVRRIVLPATVEVHPIEGWGALQTGVHHFVEDGASTRTIARFHHLWQRVDGAWKLARVVSVHEVVPEGSGMARKGDG